MTDTRVQIVDPEHPFFGKHGVFTGKIVSILGERHAEIVLDPGAVSERTYATAHQIEAERRGKAIP
jgi:hypothetical protein